MRYFFMGWFSAIVFPAVCLIVVIFKNAFRVSFDQVRGD